MAIDGQSYGSQLPDQVERIATVFDAHVALISDVRDLYRDRAALEREYATKLQALTKRAVEKKNKMELSLVLGDEPTKAFDTSSLKQNTLNNAYDEIVRSMENTAQDHIDIAESLTSQVVEVLKVVGRANEEAKRKELQFFQKLLADRDRVYNERVKSKEKYAEECAEADTHRQKQGRAADDKHAERAAKQAEQQRNEMLNSKNMYLINIAIANKAKAKFYNQDLPELENQLQQLQTRLVGRVVKTLLHCQNLQVHHLGVLGQRLGAVEQVLAQVDPLKDQSLFIEHNIRSFAPPADWKFEACVNYYDTGEMSVEAAPKIFLQNKLRRCRSKLSELEPLIAAKGRDVDQLARPILSYQADHTTGEIDEASDSYLEAAHQLTLFTTSKTILDAEIDVIVDAVHDEGDQNPHSFKSSSFSIPTQCGYCKSSIWGLSKQGKTCKACGISVHTKCELKVPANCQQPVARRSSVASGKRASIASSNKGASATPTPSSFVHSTVEDTREAAYPVAQVLFNFSPTSEFEVEVSEGDRVQILEPDDGSGWVKVSGKGQTGLVPASYISEDDSDLNEEAEGTRQYGESVEKLRNRATHSYDPTVKAIYPYAVQGSDELGLTVGEVIELSDGPTGGRNYGNGWWEGRNSRGQTGIFPSNYVEAV